jgi:hypothetical protein
MRYHSGRLGLVFAPALLALIIGGSAAHADTVLYSTSFENPVFVDGGTATQSGPYHADSSTGPLVDVSADIAIFSSTSQSEWQFGALGPGLSQFLGGIDILPNNDIIALTNGNPVIGIFPRATTFDSSAWHQINLLFNIPAQTYSIALDGVTIDSNVAFCGDNGPCSGAPVAAYGDGLFDSLG